MQAKLAGLLENLNVQADVAPGAGQTYTATLWAGGASVVTCTISGASATNCTYTTHQAAIAVGQQIGLRLVSSNGAAATGVSWSINYPYQ